MGSRLELQTELEKILGAKQVYYQPPSSAQMKYDAIRYALVGKDLKRANNKIYVSVNQYDGVVIARNPDTEIPDRILSHFEMVSFGRPYTASNLNHYPFTIYY